VSHHIIFITACAQNIRLQHEHKRVYATPIAKENILITSVGTLRPNYDCCISQGSVTTVLRWAGKNIVIYVAFLRDVAHQILLKSVSVSRSYSKHNTGAVFFWKTV